MVWAGVGVVVWAGVGVELGCGSAALSAGAPECTAPECTAPETAMPVPKTKATATTEVTKARWAETLWLAWLPILRTDHILDMLPAG